MDQIKNIPIDLLRDNPYDQRKKYGDIGALADSIEERGLQNPISVVKVEDYYVIVSGHRRVHAFRHLKRKEVPAIIRKESTTKDLKIDLAVENMQRKDLLPVEKGATLVKLLSAIPSIQKTEVISDEEITKETVNRVIALLNQIRFFQTKKNKSEGIFSAEDIKNGKNLLNIVGMAPNSAITYVRLCLLPEDIQEIVVHAENASLVPDGKIPVKSAYELTRITNPELQKELCDRAINTKMKHTEVKNLVDTVIEKDPNVSRKSNSGSAERRSEDDVGAEKLTQNLLLLSAKVDSFRLKLPLMCGRLEKIQWMASLDKMKKSCLDMVNNINDLMREDLKLEGLLEYANADLEINVTNEMRYRFPSKIAEALRIREGDTLFLKIESIKRNTDNNLEIIKTC